MKVIVAGSRSIQDNAIISKAIKSTGLKITEMGSGNARGVDTLAENYAGVHHIPFTNFPAYYDLYGKPAGAIRNDKIVAWADAMIAVWDGRSDGTRDLIRAMNSAGKPVFLHLVEKKTG
jgi:YspA, cpYpsA-related SLOG family